MDLLRERRRSGTDRWNAEGFAEPVAQEGVTAFHAIGTCRMKRADDPWAAVAPDSRMRGFERLRIADASVMSRPTREFTHAAGLMIGMRGGALFGGDPQERERPRGEAA